MIALIGIKRDVGIRIRERLTIKPSKKQEILKKLSNLFKEVVIINTCNRTEIYFSSSNYNEEILRKVFTILEWDIELIHYVFCSEGIMACKHLFKLVCGYHSRIVGEDQILGQVRDGYFDSIESKTVHLELGRLFEGAIACGKEFRTEAKLYEIPVSSVSIVINRILKKECNSVMVIGYGEIGRLSIKYLLSHKIENIYLVVRNPEKIVDLEGTGVKVISFNERKLYYNKIDSIVSCTSAPHNVILEKDIKNVKKELLIFDMSVPRDVEEGVLNIPSITVLNIDEISSIDDENKALRLNRMKEYSYIIEDHLNEFRSWLSVREVTPLIKEIKLSGQEIYEKRIKTYENKGKCEEDRELIRKLIKSTSDEYINRAIEVLKEEKLKGCEEECVRIIKKIFLQKK